MRSPASLALAAALVVLAGCDASSDAPPDGHRVVQAAAGTAPLDVRFRPLGLQPGQSLDVAAGDLDLQSTALALDRHDVSLRSSSRQVLRVVGLLDGVVQQAFSVAGEKASGDVPGGSVSRGPTSVHRSVVCHGTVCHESVEYDYDLTAPDGDGSALWTYPEASPSTVDRLRFELAAAPAEARAGRVELRSPAPIAVVR